MGTAGAPEPGLKAPLQRDSASKGREAGYVPRTSPPRLPRCTGPSDTARVRQGALAGSTVKGGLLPAQRPALRIGHEAAPREG